MGLLSSAGRLNAKIKPASQGCAFTTRIHSHEKPTLEKASIHTKGPFAKVFTHLEKESDSQTHLEGTSRED